MERTRFITHKGERVLYVDFSNLQDKDEILTTIEQAKPIIAQQPEHSLLVLTCVQDTRSDGPVSQAMKEFAAHNKPYVKASAVVGVSTVQRVILEAVRLFARRDLHAFESLPAAKEWLVEQARQDKREQRVTEQTTG